MRYMIKYSNSFGDEEIGYITAMKHHNWTPKGWTELDGKRLACYSRYLDLYLTMGGDENALNDYDAPYFHLPDYRDDSDEEKIATSDLTDDTGAVLMWLNRCGIRSKDIKVREHRDRG